MPENFHPDVNRYNRTLDANTERMLRYEDRAVVNLYRILEESRAELQVKLSRHLDRSNQYSIQFYQALIADIEATMTTMQAKATGLIRDELNNSFTLGQRHLAGEVGIFEGAAISTITPKVSTAILDVIINERTDFIANLTRSVQTNMIVQIRREAALRAANANASANARNTTAIEQDLIQNQVTGIKRELAKGFAQGDSTEQLISRLTNPRDGTFISMTRASAERTVRIGMNDTYNEGRNEQMRSISERLPHIKRAWRAALKDSTPICLHLHGQVVSVGQNFSYGGWQGDRPPAIGSGATPKFHLCRSCVVATSDRWPPNPMLEPLDAERLEHYERGGGFQDRDIASPNRAK